MRYVIFLLMIPITVFCQTDYTQLVNPFIGTGAHGHTYPGATMPFGMMQLSPDTRMADWDGSSGYHYSDTVMYGFSHTHLSGTGIPDYCDLLLMPFSGAVQWDKANYRSGFSHQDETARPGYYEVMLRKHGIRAQLTTSYRSGMHQYHYGTTADAVSVLIDLKHRDEVLESYIEKLNDYEIRGFRRSKSWAANQYFYFHLQFDQPIIGWITNNAGKIGSSPLAAGTAIQSAIHFRRPADGMLRVKVGISAVSEEGARLNLATEIPHWNFQEVATAAKTAWNKALGTIAVKGGTPDQRVNFYTALYHTMVVPNIFQDVDGRFRGTDNRIHTAEQFTNYSVFSLWDTYRAYHPLMTIIDGRRTRDWIRSFLEQYRRGGMLPVWELAANETFCMIGYHAVPVIVDAAMKGLVTENQEELLQAMISYAESNRFGLEHYRSKGYISNEKEHESVSKTLEYAYDDWCIAIFARQIGNMEVYHRYIQRAQYYKNVFDPHTRHMRGKLQALWYSPFDPAEVNNFYTEANGWQYSFAVPHDLKNLITLHGGSEPFAARLDELFTTTTVPTGREQPDVTGLIGQYAHGNEPSHHMAYLFNYVGRPWRTQEIVHFINNSFYRNDPEGLIGNEDCGQMSAWYIFSAMGFYPVCPGSNEYVLGTPLFDEVVIHLENGGSFTITANRANSGDFYVQQTKLNGQQSLKSFIRHEDIVAGGSLHFELGGAPHQYWGTGIENLPGSVIDAAPIVAAPFFETDTHKFRQEARISIASIDPGASYYYSFWPDTMMHSFKRFDSAFTIRESRHVLAYAERGNERSAVVSQLFHRMPDDVSISVHTPVHPMYTAGGADALVDGVLGSENWKAGEWQSYFGNDLEATIDLQRIRAIPFLGVHVLQDVSPWILFPKEVIFYTSNDGSRFREVLRIKNRQPLTKDKVELQTLGRKVNLRARYIRVRVVNGGRLPAWHESAGQPSHLFIDEILLK